MNSDKFDKPQFSLRRSFFGFILIILAVSLGGSRMPTILEQVITSGTLTVISRNGPSTYYEGPNGITGFEYNLLKDFAKKLNLKLEITEEENLSTMFSRVEHGNALFAAAGLTVTEPRLKRVRFTLPYLQVTQQLLFNRDAEEPDTVADLIGKEIVVIAGSSHVERLKVLQKEHPALSWREHDNLDMIDLIEMVHRGEVDHAIIDSNAFQINRPTFPKARVAFNIGEAQPLGWAFPKTADNSLFDQAQIYLQEKIDSGSLEKLISKFFDYDSHVSTGGALLFTERLENRLPKWRALIEESATEHDIDWQLLAAISYQESHWNPKARSHTGVRGFMMLTRITAKELGIKNRSNAEQSIKGGTRYYRRLLDRLPASIQGQDRNWMALAAYNVGMGHLEDARILTQSQGGNQNLWSDVKERLPLLSKRKFYRNTKRGYARGHEAVDYVRNIRQFREIITWHSLQQQRRDTLDADAVLAEGDESAEPVESTDIDMPSVL